LPEEDKEGCLKSRYEKRYTAEGGLVKGGDLAEGGRSTVSENERVATKKTKQEKRIQQGGEKPPPDWNGVREGIDVNFREKPLTKMKKPPSKLKIRNNSSMTASKKKRKTNQEKICKPGLRYGQKPGDYLRVGPRCLGERIEE